MPFIQEYGILGLFHKGVCNLFLSSAFRALITLSLVAMFFLEDVANNLRICSSIKLLNYITSYGAMRIK